MSLLNLKKRSLILCAAVGVGAALALTALLVLPVAAAVHRELLSVPAGEMCAGAAAGIAVFVPAILITRARGRQVLATGGAIAGAYAALAALCCALGGAGFAFGPWLIRLAGAAAIGGLGGAVLSLRQNPHRKKRR